MPSLSRVSCRVGLLFLPPEERILQKERLDIDFRMHTWIFLLVTLLFHLPYRVYSEVDNTNKCG